MTTKEQYWKHREKIRAYNREWYEKNKEEQKQKKKEYRQKVGSKIYNKYRNKDDEARWKFECRKWAWNRKERILSLHDNFCDKCNTKENLELHHMRYDKSIAVITVICHKCHVQQHIVDNTVSAVIP